MLLSQRATGLAASPIAALTIGLQKETSTPGAGKQEINRCCLHVCNCHRADREGLEGVTKQQPLD